MISEATIRAGRYYRSLGFNPIPSCPRLGYPPWPYSHARDIGLSEKSFNAMVEREFWTNIQIPTGRRWGVAILDVEGPIGSNLVEGWSAWHGMPPSWCDRSPRGGYHLWFRVPASGPEVESRHVWQAPPDAPRDGVEILGAGKLCKVPPSGKTVGGVWTPYRWLPGRSPADLALAPFPEWLRRIDHREDRPGKIRPHLLAGGYTPSVVTRWDGTELPNWKDVLASIPDKRDLADRWNLPIVSKTANSSGWMRAYCVLRDDNNPSAMFSETSGRWWEPDMGRNPITPFDLAVRLGLYPDFATALMSIAKDYGWRT